MLPRGVQQYAQSAGPVLKKLLPSSAYDDAVPDGCSPLNDTVCNPKYALAINKVELGRINAVLIASSKEGFEEPVVQRIISFLPALAPRPRRNKKLCNLLSQALVPQFPAGAV